MTTLPAGWKPMPASLYDLILTGDLESLLWKLKGVHEAEEVRMALYNARQAILAAEEYSDCAPPASAQDDAKDETQELLQELHALVWGECPSLLNEDSGGNSALDMRIRDAIDSARAAPAAGDARDAERWRFIRRKLCLTGDGDGTCGMHAINLPASIPGWPDPGAAVAEFCDAAIDAAIASQQGEGGNDA
ncbi:hypothetical protein ACTJNK_29180 [Achromobacter anxifer]